MLHRYLVQALATVARAQRYDAAIESRLDGTLAAVDFLLEKEACGIRFTTGAPGDKLARVESHPKARHKRRVSTTGTMGKKTGGLAMGSLYKRGDIWWVKYYWNGRPIRESTGTEKETEARRMLKEREGRVATGQPILPRVDRIQYGEAAKDLRQHYKTTGSRNLEAAEYRLKHLDAFFAGRRIAVIESADTTAYAAKRQGGGASNATINRELETLSRMLRLAYEHNKLIRLPVIHKLTPTPLRQGFFERDQFEAVRRYLRPDHQLAATIAHTFGWRMQREVLTLERRQFDMNAGTLRLEPGTTKNDDGRVVYLTPELKSLVAAQVERVKTLERTMGRVVPYLFPHLEGPHRGKRIGGFKNAWRTACVQAGCSGMLRHDFRRTAVRNMVNLGVPKRVAMKVSGHRSRSVFDRYHIVSPGDLQEVARKLTGTFSGTMSSTSSANPSTTL
jgi:integrase